MIEHTTTSTFQSSPLHSLFFSKNCDDDDEHIITSHTHSSHKSSHRQFILITTNSISSTTKLMQRFGSVLRVSYLSRRYVFLFFVSLTLTSLSPNPLDIHTISIHLILYIANSLTYTNSHELPIQNDDLT